MLPFNQMPSLNKNSRPFTKNNAGLSYQDMLIMKKKLSYQRKKNDNYISSSTNAEKNIIDKVSPFINNTINEATKPIIQNIKIDNSFTDDLLNKLKESIISKIQTEVLDHFKNVLTEHVKSVMSETMSQISSNLDSLRYYDDDDDISMYSRGSRSSRYSRRGFLPEENNRKYEEYNERYSKKKNISEINEVIVHENTNINHEEHIVNNEESNLEEFVTESNHEKLVTESIVNNVEPLTEELLTESIVNNVEPLTEELVTESALIEKSCEESNLSSNKTYYHPTNDNSIKVIGNTISRPIRA